MSQLCGIRFSVNYESDSKIGVGGIVPTFAGRGLAHLYDAWRLWRWMRELVTGTNTIGQEVIDPGGRSVEKPREVTLTFNLIFDIRSSFSFICNISHFGLSIQWVKILHVPIKQTFCTPQFHYWNYNKIITDATNTVNFSFQSHTLLLLKFSPFLSKVESTITIRYVMSPCRSQ
jgi:hypothetical protein